MDERNPTDLKSAEMFHQFRTGFNLRIAVTFDTIAAPDAEIDGVNWTWNNILRKAGLAL